MVPEVLAATARTIDGGVLSAGTSADEKLLAGFDVVALNAAHAVPMPPSSVAAAASSAIRHRPGSPAMAREAMRYRLVSGSTSAPAGAC